MADKAVDVIPAVKPIEVERYISELIDGIGKGKVLSVTLKSLAAGAAIDVQVTTCRRFQLKSKV